MHQLDCAGLHEYSGGFGRFSDTRSHCLTEKGSVAAFTEGKLGLFMTNSCSALFLEKHPFWIPLKEPRRVLSTELHLSSVSVCSCTRKVHLKTLSKLLTLVMVSFVSAAERINVQYAIYFLKR